MMKIIFAIVLLASCNSGVSVIQPCDSIHWIPKDSIKWTTIPKDSIKWTTIPKDSIKWTTRDSTRVIVSDTAVLNKIPLYIDTSFWILRNDRGKIIINYDIKILKK